MGCCLLEGEPGCCSPCICRLLECRGPWGAVAFSWNHTQL